METATDRKCNTRFCWAGKNDGRSQMHTLNFCAHLPIEWQLECSDLQLCLAFTFYQYNHFIHYAVPFFIELLCCLIVYCPGTSQWHPYCLAVDFSSMLCPSLLLMLSIHFPCFPVFYHFKTEACSFASTTSPCSHLSSQVIAFGCVYGDFWNRTTIRIIWLIRYELSFSLQVQHFIFEEFDVSSAFILKTWGKKYLSLFI